MNTLHTCGLTKISLCNIIFFYDENIGGSREKHMLKSYDHITDFLKGIWKYKEYEIREFII